MDIAKIKAFMNSDGSLPAEMAEELFKEVDKLYAKIGEMISTVPELPSVDISRTNYLGVMSESQHMYQCPSCNNQDVTRDCHFCPSCGIKLNWTDTRVSEPSN